MDVKRSTPTQLRAPRLGAVAPMERSDLLANPDWQDVEITHDLSAESLDQVSLRSVRCVDSQFVGTDLRGARIVDTAFERCDLAGARIDEATLTRVEFRECRMSGVQFNASRLGDVRFVGCRLDGANFRMVVGDRLWFEDCDLVGAEFFAAQVAGARFDGCRLTGTDFAQARIPDPSLVGSVVDGIRGIDGLQRPVIDQSQVLPLAFVLMTVHGVVIKDDD